MTGIRKLKKEDIEQCVGIYVSAYAAEPWEEAYAEAEIRKYLSEFMKAGSMHCFVLTEEEEIIGVALMVLIPGVEMPYLRVEDFFIGADKHRKGYGSRFIELLTKEAEKMGCDSILLGTQRGFPAHDFYLKNGFQEIESVLLYREIKQ